MFLRIYALGDLLSRIIAILLFLVAFPHVGHSEQQPSSGPYVLSEAVQSRAAIVNVWNTALRDAGYDPSTFPTALLRGFGTQALQVYLDQLTAADVMAKQRARRQGKTAAETDDYDIMFASWCVFIPNKPPASPALQEISKGVRKFLLGSYVNEAKRKALVEAMRPVLLEGTKEGLFRTLGQVKTFADYNEKVLDTTKLK